MKRWAIISLGLSSPLLFLLACTSRVERPTPPTGVVTQSSPTAVVSASAVPTAFGPAATPTVAFQPRAEVIATGLQVPWAMAFATHLPFQSPGAPGGVYLFVTERPGQLRLIIDGQLQKQAVLEVPHAQTDEGGLLGLALDPNFEQNGYLYLLYTVQDSAGLHNRISRFTLDGLKAGSEKVLLEGIPAGTIHNGGRLKFGPDGKLYATTGDTTQRQLAQRLDSLAGKILRINPDGSIPLDNPFPGSPVYSYGHRNPEGLAWQPATQQLFNTEHGPSSGVEDDLCCHDEINRIVAGGNYGWPEVIGIAGDRRFLDPVFESGNDTWAPSGATFYDGTLLTAWQGNLFFGALRGRHLHRLIFGGPNLDQVVGEERLFQDQFGRIRDVAVGPDGALYFTTSNRDYRWPPVADDDRVVRVVPGP